eukprot:TRINITY_DN7278_c0_g1_i5.p1 TRINITY_DN7278_c0_g1~~TRINITY_DN7278_c0_g1_i5.p1  ORF type:complete len:209 (+),score=-0.90 TRINITY_DN7278_c0_g1_i5:38-664(+)
MFYLVVQLLYDFLAIFFFLVIRRPPRSTLSSSSAASDVYKRQQQNIKFQTLINHKFQNPHISFYFLDSQHAQKQIFQYLRMIQYHLYLKLQFPFFWAQFSQESVNFLLKLNFIFKLIKQVKLLIMLLLYLLIMLILYFLLGRKQNEVLNQPMKQHFLQINLQFLLHTIKNNFRIILSFLQLNQFTLIKFKLQLSLSQCNSIKICLMNT